MTSFVVRPLPGPGLVVRAGGLFGVCADTGDGVQVVLNLVTEAAKPDSDGGSLVDRLADLLATGAVERPSACALAGVGADGTVSVFVHGAATAESAGGPEPVRLSGRQNATVHRIPAGVTSVRLALARAGAPDPRLRLDAGVVPGAGVVADLTEGPPARFRPAAERIRQPDLSLPFESVLLVDALPVVDASPVVDALPVVDASPVGFAPATPLPDGEPVETRVLVEGVNCKNGHFNDPDGRYCQICGISMAQLTHVARLGPRPPLGVLLFDDGMTFRLETDYVLGRDPHHDPRVADGSARPLRIADRTGGLSRRQLHIGLVGWTVQLVDLGSANGTFVQSPGDHQPVRLVPGQPVEIRPGTRIIVGRRWLRYESHRSP